MVTVATDTNWKNQQAALNLLLQQTAALKRLRTPLIDRVASLVEPWTNATDFMWIVEEVHPRPSILTVDDWRELISTFCLWSDTVD